MKNPIDTPKPVESLEQHLEQLKQLRPEELRTRWQTLFGSTAPPRLRSSLMVQAIARRLQEKALPARDNLELISDSNQSRRHFNAAGRVRPSGLPLRRCIRCSPIISVRATS
jgi:hypothetical protein